MGEGKAEAGAAAVLPFEARGRWPVGQVALGVRTLAALRRGSERNPATAHAVRVVNRMVDDFCQWVPVQYQVGVVVNGSFEADGRGGITVSLSVMTKEEGEQIEAAEKAAPDITFIGVPSVLAQKIQKALEELEADGTVARATQSEAAAP